MKKKTITLTREEFKSKAADALAEVITKMSNGDIVDTMKLAVTAAVFGAEIEIALFKEEEKDGNRN